MISLDVINEKQITAEVLGDEIVINVIKAAATTYDALLDTPDSKIGQAGKFPQVNGAETLHEYVKIQDVETLTDGATIVWDWQKVRTRYARLGTANSRIIDLQNVPIPTDTIFEGAIGNVITKKNVLGDIVLTLQGAGFKFYDMIDKALGATLVITFSGANGDFFEISCEINGEMDGADYIVFTRYE